MPTQDISIQIVPAPVPHHAPRTAEYNATVTQRVDVAPGLMILRVVPDARSFPFTAGQYVVLGLKASEPRVVGTDDDPESEAPTTPEDKLVRRAYSIASSSRGEDFLEFYLTLVTSGELTPRLFHLRADDRVYLGPKAVGVFTLARTPQDRHVLLVGTGTGLAPYMSMLRSELACGGPRRVIVLHGARYSWDLGYRAELAGLARHCPNLTYIPVVSRPTGDPTWRGHIGHLQDVLFSGVVENEIGLRLTPEHFHVYLCGHPGMIDQAIVRLVEREFRRDRGRESGSLHTEEYW
jgi:ferredoxin--NADP+ reductase